MKITVTKDKVSIIEKDIVHVGEYNINHIEFEFSAEYTADLVKNAVFTNNLGKSYQTSVLNNECYIPAEILSHAGSVIFGVYAYKIVDEKLELRYSPFPTSFVIISGSYDFTAEEGQEITPSQFEQYMQAMNDGLNKVEASIKKMDSATSAANNLVNDINQKLENGDFIGPQGPQGVQGTPGKDGINGTDGVGITTITSGQSTVEEDKTITPVTVQKTDGSSQSFKVEAKNGIDGQDGVNGQDGLTPSIGENGNWFLGDTDTGKPSRGEVGPSPDLSDYVKNTDYANTTKAGVFKPTRNLYVNPETGYVYAQPVSKEEYNSSEDTIFMAKGTSENIKDDYVGSSIPVKNLNNSLRDLTPKQDAEGTDNTFDDGLESPLYALGGDGKSEQVTTTGKNLLNYTNIKPTNNGIANTLNDDGSITTTGSPKYDYLQILNRMNITDLLEDGQMYTIMQKNATDKLYIQVGVISNEDVPNYIGLGTNLTNTATFTVDKKSNKSYSISIQTNTIETSTDLNITNYYQLLKGSYDEWQPFEKYTGGQPSPSPDYPQEINSIEGSVEFACRGKNLFNKNTVVDGYLSQTGQIESNRGFKTSDFIKVMSNTSYFLNKTNTRRLKFYDINKNAITSDWDLTSAGSQSFTTLRNAYYLRFSIDINAIDINTVQLELGTQATEYEPYIEPNKVTFNLNEEKLRSVGDVKDELVVDLDTGAYYKVENVGEVVFDGSDDENWKLDAITAGTEIRQFSNLIGNVLDKNDGIVRVISNYFKGVMWHLSWTFNNTITTYTYGNLSGVRLQSDKFEDVEQLKQWFSTNNTIVNYILKKPTTKKLGTLSSEDLAKLKTFKGYNNVTVNTNLGLMNIRFTYGLDIKKYVDNKIAELSAQLIKGE